VYRTRTGVPILVRRKRALAAARGAYILGGARDEPPAQAGLTSLLVRTAIKGTERRHRGADR